MAVDLAEMGSFSSKNKNIKNLLCAIDVFTKPLKDKKGKTVLNAFIQILNESNCNQVNYGLIKEGHFTINFCKNGQTIIF